MCVHVCILQYIRVYSVWEAMGGDGSCVGTFLFLSRVGSVRDVCTGQAVEVAPYLQAPPTLSGPEITSL